MLIVGLATYGIYTDEADTLERYFYNWGKREHFTSFAASKAVANTLKCIMVLKIATSMPLTFGKTFL